MKKVLLGVALACATLASDDPKNYDSRTTVESLHGTWLVQSVEYDGQPAPPEDVKAARMVINGNKMAYTSPSYTMNATFTFDPTRHPATLDILPLDGHDKGKLMKMIYRLDGTTLKLAGYEGGSPERPTEFRSTQGSRTGLMILKRADIP